MKPDNGETPWMLTVIIVVTIAIVLWLGLYGDFGSDECIAGRYGEECR